MRLDRSSARPASARSISRSRRGKHEADRGGEDDLAVLTPCRRSCLSRIPRAHCKRTVNHRKHVTAPGLRASSRGEGSFIASRGARSSYPVIKVEMCEQEVIERAARLFDTRVWVVPPGAEGWRPTYVAQIAGRHAAEWMRALRPYMGLRRTAAIDAALSAYHPVRLIAPPLVCVVEGCERPHRARGLCNTHYMSWSRDRAKGRVPRITPLR